MNRHFSGVTLARYRAGDLPARRSSRIARHVAGCDRCSGLDADLDRVTALLAATSVPPMPDRLAGRIQAAISAESAARAGQAAPAGPAEPASVTRPDGEDHRVRPVRHDRHAPADRRARAGRQGWLSWLGSPVAVRALAAAAAAVVLAGGGYLVSQNVGSGGTAIPSSAAAPSVGRAAAGPELHYGPGSHQVAFRPITTDADLAKGSLEGQVRAGLAAERSSGQSAQAGPSAATLGPSGSAGAHRSTATTPAPVSGSLGRVPVDLLEGCVGRLAGTGNVLLVDVARYKGSPATLIVVQVAVAKPLEVWVVGPACSASASDVLRYTTLPAGSV